MFIPRLFIAYFLLREHPTFLGIWPLKIPDETSKAVLHALFMPFILTRWVLSFLLYGAPAKILSLFTVGVTIYGNSSRCGMELSEFPGQGQRYFQFLSFFQEILATWFPFSSTFSFGKDTFSSNLSELGACIAFKSTLHIVFGYFIPMAVLLAEELFSRKIFRKKYGLANNLTHSVSIMIVQYLFLVPFQAAVTFQLLVFLSASMTL